MSYQATFLKETDYFTYFVWKKPLSAQSYRVVRREVKMRTHKGYPVMYSLKAIEQEFDCWAQAKSVADELNCMRQAGGLVLPPEVEIGEMD